MWVDLSVGRWVLRLPVCEIAIGYSKVGGFGEEKLGGGNDGGLLELLVWEMSSVVSLDNMTVSNGCDDSALGFHVFGVPLCLRRRVHPEIVLICLAASIAKQQLRNLELAFDSIKQQLVKRNEELEENNNLCARSIHLCINKERSTSDVSYQT